MIGKLKRITLRRNNTTYWDSPIRPDNAKLSSELSGLFQAHCASNTSSPYKEEVRLPRPATRAEQQRAYSRSAVHYCSVTHTRNHNDHSSNNASGKGKAESHGDDDSPSEIFKLMVKPTYFWTY